jgi:HK97 gp10 family phage protein
MKFGMNVKYHFDPLRPDKVMDAIMDALKDGAEFITARSKQIVPVRTGVLKRSIKMNELEEPRKGYTIGPDPDEQDYDAYVEFGTGTRGEGSAVFGKKWKTNIRGQRAQPYMRPALAEARPKIAQALQVGVRKALS